MTAFPASCAKVPGDAVAGAVRRRALLRHWGPGLFAVPIDIAIRQIVALIVCIL